MYTRLLAAVFFFVMTPTNISTTILFIFILVFPSFSAVFFVKAAKLRNIVEACVPAKATTEMLSLLLVNCCYFKLCL